MPGLHMQDQPVTETVETDEAAAEGSDEEAPVPAPAPALGPQEVQAELYVKDAGMMLVSTVAPDFTWQSGNADIAIKCAAVVLRHASATALQAACIRLTYITLLLHLHVISRPEHNCSHCP